MTKKIINAEQIPPRETITSGQAKKLYNLITKIPDEVYDTNPVSRTSKKNVLEGLNAEFFQPISLDTLVTLDDVDHGYLEPRIWSTLRSELADYSQQRMLDKVELNTLVFNMLKELALYKYKWFEVIMFRFGFWDGTVWKLQEIAEQLDVTRERVRQIEAESLKMLRSILLRHALLAEVREFGVVRRRKVRIPISPALQEPKKRGRPPKVYTVEPLSEMDMRSWAPLNEVSKILGVPMYTMRNWQSGSGFPEPRKNYDLKARVYSVQQVLDWGIQHERVRIQHRENDGSNEEDRRGGVLVTG